MEGVSFFFLFFLSGGGGGGGGGWMILKEISYELLVMIFISQIKRKTNK